MHLWEELAGGRAEYQYMWHFNRSWGKFQFKIMYSSHSVLKGYFQQILATRCSENKIM